MMGLSTLQMLPSILTVVGGPKERGGLYTQKIKESKMKTTSLKKVLS